MTWTSEQKFKVLIADDDPDDHYFIKRAITQLKIRTNCYSVNNGLELMDMLVKKELNPDLIILDLNMPLLDGFGALEKIRNNERIRNIPVFVLSTTSFDYDVKKSRDLGAVDIYRKPYHYEKLKDIVEDMFTKTLVARAGLTERSSPRPPGSQSL